METITNGIVMTVTNISKHTGWTIAVTQSAFVVSLLAWCNVITPILGMVAALTGVIIGIHSVWIKVIKPMMHKRKLKKARVKPSKHVDYEN